MHEAKVRVELRKAIHRARVETYGPKQVDFERATGISQSQISRWESGKTIPTVLQLIRVAEACNRTAEDLIVGLSEPEGAQLLLGLDERSQAVIVDLVALLKTRTYARIRSRNRALARRLR